VITVSEAARASIVQHLGVATARVFVTYEAASRLYRPVHDPARLAAMRQQLGLPKGFILAIGSADPRKNLTALVEAYAQLPASLQEQYHLAIVWTHSFLASELTKQVETLGIQPRLHFLEKVSDETLLMLYNAAALFVFPSRYEGFGLPLLEAMACGTPVLAANNSSIPEIVGDAAVLVEADQVATITHGIERVLTDEPLRFSLIEKGLQRSASFSWTKCGAETLAIYQQSVAQ
jgi:glycosyltransferase involved in cell wall biosynthesis